jgi:hypothetical protein
MNMDGLMGFNRYEWKYNGDLTGDVTLEIRFDLAGLQHFRDTLREASRFGGKKQDFLETFLIRRENQPINNNQLYFMHRFHQGSFICEGPPNTDLWPFSAPKMRITPTRMGQSRLSRRI